MPVAADVETYKQRPFQFGSRLLGVALSGYDVETDEIISAYVVFTHYNKAIKDFKPIFPFEDGPECLNAFLSSTKTIGWNVPFDKMWLDCVIGQETNWHADGRILWHLQNNDPTIRGFGLKLAQKKLLEWRESNDTELENNIALYGGRISNGDHYLADLPILAKYACADTYSTLLCYEYLHGFIDKHEYWDFADSILQYAIELMKSSTQGLNVDVESLTKSAGVYEQKREEAKVEVRKICEAEIAAIEETWKVKKLANYKTERGRNQFLQRYQKWQKFNPSSGQQRALLLHTMLEFPILERTPTQQPKTDRANLAAIPHNAAKTLIAYSEYKKIAEQAKTYLTATENGRMYTNYDVCGTVSGRLSGFKPSVLNMPFSEKEVMGAFTCDEGYVGIHADLASIEPCVLGHYSEDPGLLKVYAGGRGDIYLDLALSIFPDRQDLKEGYNPDEPIRSKVKEQFKDLRAVCKTIHLAVSYTGTHITVAKNLSKAGYLTDKTKAMQLVSRYWRKFAKVKAFNHRLQEVYEDRGYIRNIAGRVIQVPIIYKKDLMNRLIQSSAHDILRLWVMRIIEEFETRGVVWKHWLPDLHDSTTFQIKEGQEELARQCYESALQWAEAETHISVPLKCELKFVKTLAGLKGSE